MRNTKVEARIVTTYEELQHAYAVRAVCFMHEHGYKARQVFDGNDYQCTNVNLYENDEPIGTIRIRWFRDFVKLERMCLMPGHRGVRYITAMAQTIFPHCARKGFDRVITHAAPEYAAVWERLFKFQRVDKPCLRFDGHSGEYVELERYISLPENVLGADTDIATLFRVEGEWDRKSEFEASV